ncbi:hypothetical protein ACSMEV_14080 [Pseudomonas sp. MLB6B]|uniref:hypothetical protein n=1 Tax=Pseudomonas sp. TaxID=306 RepID=UPI0028B07AF5|nr:hypothetical protein [Pseudomonas sp.]
MADPRDTDPYIDNDLHIPGEPKHDNPNTDPNRSDTTSDQDAPPAPEWPEGQVPPEDQSGG